MTALGPLCACVLATSAGGAGEAPAERPRPKRDLFGTAGRRPGAPGRSAPRVWGTVELSNGERAEGWISLTPGRPLEVYDLDAREWREFEIHEIGELRAAPRKEEIEREWRWKEYGKDEKVYTGRAYPKRWLEHVIVLRGRTGQDGERLGCHIRGAALYVTKEPDRTAAGEERDSDEKVSDDKTLLAKGPGARKPDAKKAAARRPDEKDAKMEAEAPRRRRFILRQYERGELGQTLDDLVYVKLVTVHDKDRAAKQEAGKKRTRTKGSARPASGRKRASAAK